MTSRANSQDRYGLLLYFGTLGRVLTAPLSRPESWSLCASFFLSLPAHLTHLCAEHQRLHCTRVS